MLVNFPYVGNYIIQVDLYIHCDLDIVWHYLDYKNQILVKVEEDPIRQKLFAALAASNAAAAASSSVTINSTGSFVQQSNTPNGTHVPLMYRTVTPTSSLNENIETKMET